MSQIQLIFLLIAIVCFGTCAFGPDLDRSSGIRLLLAGFFFSALSWLH